MGINLKKAKIKAAFFILLAIIVVLSLCLLWLNRTHGTRKIPMDHVSHISTIYILTKSNELEKMQSLSGADIPEVLENDLLQCIGNYLMTSASISPSQSMELSDSYIYISIWIFNTDGTSFRINLSNNEHHSSVQFDEKYFGIINSRQMLDDVKSILTPAC